MFFFYFMFTLLMVFLVAALLEQYVDDDAPLYETEARTPIQTFLVLQGGRQ